MVRSCAIVLVLASAAHAEPVDRVLAQLASQEPPLALKAPRFAITNDDVAIDPPELEPLRLAAGLPLTASASRPTTGATADGKVAWVAAELTVAQACFDPVDDQTGDAAYYRPEYCKTGDSKAWFHGAALFERDGATWQPVAWHIGGRKLGATSSTAPLTRLARAIAPGAEAAAATFERSIGDPVALGKTISARTDVALLGSDQAEIVVGGAKVRDRLARWKLALKVRDGVRAGLTTSKTVAWVAANLDAKGATYRTLAIYERTGARWELVQLSFTAAK